MGINRLRAAIGALFVMVSAPALAAPLLFEISPIGDASAGYTFSFTLDTDTVPNPLSSAGPRFNGTPITYTRPGDATTTFVENDPFDGPTFFTSGQELGGIALQRFQREPVENVSFRLFGVQLFTGSIEDPVFAPQSYDLSTVSGTSPANYRLTISDPTLVSAAPEPATWAMMLTGFGAAGVAIRRRRREESRSVA